LASEHKEQQRAIQLPSKGLVPEFLDSYMEPEPAPKQKRKSIKGVWDKIKRAFDKLKEARETKAERRNALQANPAPEAPRRGIFGRIFRR